MVFTRSPFTCFAGVTRFFVVNEVRFRFISIDLQKGLRARGGMGAIHLLNCDPISYPVIYTGLQGLLGPSWALSSEVVCCFISIDLHGAKGTRTIYVLKCDPAPYPLIYNGLRHADHMSCECDPASYPLIRKRLREFLAPKVLLSRKLTFCFTFIDLQVAEACKSYVF